MDTNLQGRKRSIASYVVFIFNVLAASILAIVLIVGSGFAGQLNLIVAQAMGTDTEQPQLSSDGTGQPGISATGDEDGGNAGTASSAGDGIAGSTEGSTASEDLNNTIEIPLGDLGDVSAGVDLSNGLDVDLDANLNSGLPLVDDTVNGAVDTVNDVVDSVEDVANDTVQTVEDTVDDVQDTVEDTVDEVQETVDDTLNTITGGLFGN